MKIGFFTDAYFPQVNGVVTSVHETVKELRRRGHDVYIITSRYPNYKDDKKDNVVRLASVLINKKLNIRLATHFPEKELFDVYKMDFDIIHAHSGGTISLLGLEIASFKKIPIVFTYHTLWKNYTHYLLNGLLIKPKMIEVVSRIFCNKCVSIIAPNKRIKDELLSYDIKKPISIIPSGLDLKKFSNAKKGFLREKLKLKKTDKILLTVGRLGKEKSVDFLIKAFELVRKKNENTILLIAGDGPEKKNLQHLASKLGLKDKIYFLGNIDLKYMPLVYGDADIFLFASTTETQGLVLLEAMASGVPVVAIKDEVIQDLVKTGRNGFVTEKNIDTYTSRILELLVNKKLLDEFSQNTKKTVLPFSIVKSVDHLERLYFSLVSTNVFKEEKVNIHKNPSKPSVSVVIPAYNEEKYIEKVLQSLTLQTYKDFEVIVVDNNSSDSTGKIARKYGARVIFQKKRGLPLARQTGFMIAKGDIIVSTDADAVVQPDWLEKIKKEFDADLNLVGYGGMYRLYSGPVTSRIAVEHGMYYLYSLGRIFSNGWVLIGPNFAVRRDAFLRVGGFDTTLFQGEDIDISQKLQKVGKVVLDKDLYVLVSGRRFKDGLIPGLISYGLNWPAKVFFGKDLTKPLEVIR